MSKLRLLYSSNAPWATSGYAIQGKSLCPRLAALPEVDGKDNLAIFAWYGLQSGMHEYDGFKVYPGGLDPYGNDIVEAHTKHFNANVVITLIDVWVNKDTARKTAPALWLPWLPIDHDPVPAVVLDSLKGAHLPLTYSKWGHDLLAAAGVANAYIPHGIETSVYRVNPDLDKIARFKQMLAPGCDHLTVWVAANKGFPDRKGFQQGLRAWARFAADKPGARLYMHTEPTQMYQGIDLPALLGNLGITDKVSFPSRYDYFMGFPAEYLALVYNAADVLLGASMSEGFGIPLIEAQGCGTPVITTAFSAMPELVRWGSAVPPADVFWTNLNSWQAWPNAVGIAHELERLYAAWDEHGRAWPMARRLQAQDAIHAEYSWDSIVRDQWAPLMTRLAGEVVQDTPTIAPLPEPAHAGTNGHEAVFA